MKTTTTTTSGQPHTITITINRTNGGSSRARDVRAIHHRSPQRRGKGLETRLEPQISFSSLFSFFFYCTNVCLYGRLHVRLRDGTMNLRGLETRLRLKPQVSFFFFFYTNDYITSYVYGTTNADYKQATRTLNDASTRDYHQHQHPKEQT